jgi:hypothetical protein
MAVAELPHGTVTFLFTDVEGVAKRFHASYDASASRPTESSNARSGRQTTLQQRRRDDA